jgi:dUTP pyrophosphatase
MLPVTIHRVRPSQQPVPVPQYTTAGAAGVDLRADLESALELPPMARAAIPTGFAVAIPDGFEGQIRTRSGLALDDGLVCLNSPGTIDSDYRGEVLVVLANLSAELKTIRRGDRIAQLVFSPVARAVLTEGTLPPSRRGPGGLGSTGRE